MFNLFDEQNQYLHITLPSRILTNIYLGNNILVMH